MDIDIDCEGFTRLWNIRAKAKKNAAGTGEEDWWLMRVTRCDDWHKSEQSGDQQIFINPSISSNWEATLLVVPAPLVVGAVVHFYALA